MKYTAEKSIRFEAQIKTKRRPLAIFEALQNHLKGTKHNIFPLSIFAKPSQSVLTFFFLFCELFLKPIEHHLEEMVNESTTGKPSLLIIPREDTFNIPYAALRLENGKHLCNQLTLLEAYSFHSFIHSNRRTEATNEGGYQMEKSLIVGNPTNDLPKLPCAEEEVEMIAKLLGVTALTKHLATRSEVLGHLSSAPIIHFACHGSSDGRCLFLAPEKEW